MPVSTTWDLVGKSQTVVVDHVRTTVPSHTVGAETDVGLTFRPAGRATGHNTRYTQAREYARWGEYVNAGRTLDGVWADETNLPASAGVDSLIVKLAPQTADSAGVFEGVWGVVRGYADDTRLQNRHPLTFRLFVLADASDYADHTAIESDVTDSILP